MIPVCIFNILYMYIIQYISYVCTLAPNPCLILWSSWKVYSEKELFWGQDRLSLFHWTVRPSDKKIVWSYPVVHLLLSWALKMLWLCWLLCSCVDWCIHCCGIVFVCCFCLLLLFSSTWLVKDGAALPRTSPFSPDLSARPWGSRRMVINLFTKNMNRNLFTKNMNRNLNDCQRWQGGNIELPRDSESSKTLNKQWAGKVPHLVIVIVIGS